MYSGTNTCETFNTPKMEIFCLSGEISKFYIEFITFKKDVCVFFSCRIKRRIKCMTIDLVMPMEDELQNNFRGNI